MINFNIHRPAKPSSLGYIPSFLSEDNPHPAATQLHNAYYHGGGWAPFAGFTLLDDNSLAYPGDPILSPLATAKLRDETICIYRYAWVAVIQPNRSFEVSRMD